MKHLSTILAIILATMLVATIIGLILIFKKTPNVQEVPERSVATPTTNQYHLTVTYQCTGLTENITLTAFKSGRPYLDDSGCIKMSGQFNGYLTYTRICGVRSFTFN